jgi:hypothetical protein
VVVGYSLTTSSSASGHAFIWTASTGMQDLNSVLKGKIPKGWILQVASDISEDGTVITGYGISPPTNQFPFGELEPWRAVLSPNWSSGPAMAPQTIDVHNVHGVPIPLINNAILLANFAGRDGPIMSSASTGTSAVATATAIWAQIRIMPAPMDASTVIPLIAAAGKSNQLLSSFSHKSGVNGSLDGLAGVMWFWDSGPQSSQGFEQ